MNDRLRVLTWHVHGNYLYYLTQADCDFYIPYDGDTPPDIASFPFGDNVHQVPSEKVKNMDLDVILYQSQKNYLEDQYEILSPVQRMLPKVYVEHDPPREHPTDTTHIVNDKHVLLVHVTHFNDLMWNSQMTPTTVIDHGVKVPANVTYSGELAKGIVVINNIQKRGRRLGFDIFERLRKEVPLDIIGMGSKEIGGLGEVPPMEVPSVISRYRFFLNPIRYTSLGLSVLEAMTVGLPIVGLATTELVTVIQNNVNGFLATDPVKLVPFIKKLLSDRSLAAEIGREARKTALERFTIKRFARDWEDIFHAMVRENRQEIRQFIQPLGGIL